MDVRKGTVPKAISVLCVLLSLLQVLQTLELPLLNSKEPLCISKTNYMMDDVCNHTQGRLAF